MKKLIIIFLFSIASLGRQYVYGQTTVFYEDFESGSLNSSFWTANPGANNGLAGVVNASGSCSGSYHLRLGKTADAGGWNTAYAQVSINLGTYVDSQLHISFCVFDNVDEYQAVEGVYASRNNGNSFTKIIDFEPLAWTDNVWGTRFPYDLDHLLTDAFGFVPSNIVLKFQQRGTGDFSNHYTAPDIDGIGIDNIHITTVPANTYATIPFSEDFNSGTLPTSFKVNSRVANDSLNRSNLTRFPSANISGNSLRLGKTSDHDGYNINAVDLYLALGSYVDSQLIFSFTVGDFAEEYNTLLDGIFASINKGQSFEKIIDFPAANWDDDIFSRRYPYDLDQLLKDKFGISSLSDTLILRFQQFDNADFASAYNHERDGILLDNLSISVDPKHTYTTLPFFEDFSNGNLASHWRNSSREANDSLSLNSLTRFPNVGIGGTNSFLFLGKSSDREGYNINAVDLFLNLGPYVDSQLCIQFDVNDASDENDPLYDGIFVSIDNGKSFEKIISYEQAAWTDNVFAKRVPYDLDQLLKDVFQISKLTDTLVIRFQQYDNADFASAYNHESDGIRFDNISIKVDRQPTFHSLPFFEDFSQPNLGSYWKIRSREANDSLGASYLSRYKRISIAGTNRNLYLGKTSDIEGYNLNAIDLHISLGTYVDSQLLFSFRIRDDADEHDPAYEGIWASINSGKSFQKIIDFSNGDWADRTWGRRVPYDLDNIIKKTWGLNTLPDSLILRFQQYDDADFAYAYNHESDGIMLDDISIKAESPTHYASIPYQNDFENGKLSREWKINSEKAISQTTLSTSPSQLNRFWRLGVVNTQSISGSYLLWMSKTSDIEGANLNALDLHVNLQGESQVQLKYRMYKFYDEQQVDDGVFLSVDGGKSFIRIHSFDLANIPNNSWQTQTLDLSNLVASSGLILSDSTVIRFQQYGTGDLNTSGDEDGIALDLIEINCLPQVADFSFDVDCSTLQVTFNDSSLGTMLLPPTPGTSMEMGD